MKDVPALSHEIDPATAIQTSPSPLLPAAAETIAPTTTDACMQAARTQAEMNKCAVNNAEQAKRRLGQLIQELAAKMGADQYARLLAIEAKWERLAKEHCTWDADFFAGGSVRPMWYATCLARQYGERIDALRIGLCEGHGMTGECEASLRYRP